MLYWSAFSERRHGNISEDLELDSLFYNLLLVLKTLNKHNVFLNYQDFIVSQ